MLSSLKISRKFVAATALAFGSAGFVPALSAADAPAKGPVAAEKVAKPLPVIDYDAIFNTQKFKDMEEFVLENSVRSNLSAAGLRQAAKDGIREFFTEKPDEIPATPENIETAALKGMMNSLSPHDAYLNKRQATGFRDHMAASFVGLGIQIDMTGKQVKVIEPIAGGPAESAGIRSGDIIKEVNGEKLDGLDSEAALAHMRGAIGSRADIKLLRDGTIVELSLIRATIKRQHAFYRMLEGGIAHIHVREFSTNVALEVKHHIAQAKADAQLDPVMRANGGLKRLILDVTDDGGGLMGEARAMVDDFLDKSGLVVSQQGRDPEDTERLASTFGDVTGGLKIAVLINEMSASASEIVAAALQDHDRAIIIGRTSFGKGTVQTVMPLPDNTIFKVTTAIFKRPSGTSNQWVGVVPEIFVETKSTKYEEFIRTEGVTERSLPNSITNPAGVDAQKGRTTAVCSPVRVQEEIKVDQAGTDKGIFVQKGDKSAFELGTINPFVACARDYLLKQANPAYVPRFTNIVPKLTN